MTPAEFAEAHGLSLEEAELILRRREAKASLVTQPSRTAERLQAAFDALAKAQKKVGVHPVQEGYFDDLHRVHDPDAEAGLEKFYSTKESKPTWKERNAWQTDDMGYPVDQSEGGADE